MACAWTVAAEDEAARLDAHLARRLKLSRHHARRLLDAGVVRLNGQSVTERHKGQRLAPGDRIDVASVTFHLTPRPDLPLTVLQEGDDFVVVDKPPAVPVHPLRPDQTDTVLNALAARYPALTQAPPGSEELAGSEERSELPDVGVGEGELRSGVVHRLDVETSGCLVFALTLPRWRDLRDAFRSHRVMKTYAAVVTGRLEGERTERLDLYVAQHTPARVKVGSRGRPCSLRWRAVASRGDTTLLEIDLHTGHLHQIRATLAHRGHPILGDAIYGDRDTAPRLMLHATALRYGDIDAHCSPPWTTPAV